MAPTVGEFAAPPNQICVMRGPFDVTVRTYRPDQSAARGECLPPPITRLPPKEES
jgi:hypothetical protein